MDVQTTDEAEVAEITAGQYAGLRGPLGGRWNGCYEVALYPGQPALLFRPDGLRYAKEPAWLR